MKSLLQKFVVSIALLFTMNATAATTTLSDTELNSIKSLPIFKNPNLVLKKGFKSEKFYILKVEIQGRLQELFLTLDKATLVAGKVYNAQTGEELKAPNDISGLKGKELFSYGTGKDVYYLFTDPECPYCKKFESYFPQIEKNVTIKVFFFPLSFHANAKELSYYVLSHKPADRAAAMFTAEITNPDFKNVTYKDGEKEKYVKMVEESIALAAELGVQGTPAVFDAKGKSLAWPEVLNKYGINPK